MHRKISFLALFVLGLAACQPAAEKPGPLLFGEFYMRYLSSERNFKAEATFFRGDSLVDAKPLALPQGVSVQGHAMEARSLVNDITRYQYKGAMDYPAEARFAFRTGEETEPRQLAFAMAPLGRFSVPGGVSRQKGFTLQAEGSRLNPDESLVLLFADPNNKANTIILKGPTKSERHVFQGKQVADFSLGTHQLYLVKKKTTARAQDDLRAQATLEYFSDVLDVTVAP